MMRLSNGRQKHTVGCIGEQLQGLEPLTLTPNGAEDGISLCPGLRPTSPCFSPKFLSWTVLLKRRERDFPPSNSRIRTAFRQSIFGLAWRPMTSSLCNAIRPRGNDREITAWRRFRGAKTISELASSKHLIMLIK